MLPTEAKNQQCATSKTDPETLSKSYPLDLVLEAQLEIDNKVLMEQCRLYWVELSINKFKIIFISKI